MSGHTPSVAGASCSDACATCARDAARELDALRDLRALVLRADTMRSEYPVNGAVLDAASATTWVHIVQAAERAKR